MEMAETLTLNKTIELDLSNQLYEFVNFMGSKVKQFGENFGIVCQKAELAEGLGKDVRTVTRYLKELSDKNIVETSTKRGRSGGTVIMFNNEVLDFEPQENPFTSETKKAEEVRDRFMPNKPKKEPKRKYRTKAEIAEERMRNGLRKDRERELNEMLAGMEFPTKEFFNQTDDPGRYYQAYLVSRMYNAYTVIFPELRMNEAEAIRDVDSFENAKSYKELYKDYDCLQKEFIGTANFTHFLKFTDYVLERNINPLSFLTVQFKFMDYLIRVGSNNVHLPFINALTSPVSVDRFNSELEYNRGFREEHPYYAIAPEEVKPLGMKYPILDLLSSAFDNPNGFKTPFEGILNTMSDYIFMSKKANVLASYHTKVVAAVEESDLSQDKKDVLIKFMNQQTATHLTKQSLVPQQYLAAFHMQIDLVKQDLEPQNIRKYYAYLGDFNKNGKVINLIEQANNVKRGYVMDFSLYGSSTFYTAIRTIADIRGFEVEPELLGGAIKEFGERKIPVNSYGFLDVQALFKKTLTEEDLEEDLKNSVPIAMNDEKQLDISGYMWYDVIENVVGTSIRDGKGVYV